jgi:hypothetical protein
MFRIFKSACHKASINIHLLSGWMRCEWMRHSLLLLLLWVTNSQFSIGWLFDSRPQSSRKPGKTLFSTIILVFTSNLIWVITWVC